jgi:hypothetical protein
MPDIDDIENDYIRDRELATMRQKNNPGNEPTGHFTGRCKCCGSNDLWDDNLTYGCNSCGAMYIF